MENLRDIPIRVEERDVPDPLNNHANALPVMHEVLHALRRLHDSGETTTIDLLSIPFAPGDEEMLMQQLGCGEVSIELQSLGKSTICETLYPGVWLIDHYNADGERIAMNIEINRVPAIVQSQDEDILDAIIRLNQKLNSENLGINPLVEK